MNILDKHLRLGFGQRLELSKSKVPYTLPHDYTFDYAVSVAREFDTAGIPVRVSSSVDGDVTGDIIGRKAAPLGKPQPSIGAKIGAAVLLGVVAIIVIGVIVAMVNGSSHKPPVTVASTPTPEVAKPISVTAMQLFNAYQRNEIRADNVFKGQDLLVTGVVDSINKGVIYLTP